MKVINKTKGTILSTCCPVADNFFTRFKGLMGKKALLEGEGILITPCNSVHMFFMKFPIDIVFIDKSQTILYMKEYLKPWELSKVVRNAKSVIELPAGTLKKTGTAVGDELIFDSNI